MILTLDPATIGFGIPLREYIEIAAAAGFKAVEFSIEQLQQDEPDQIVFLCQQRGIVLAQLTCGIGTPSNLCVSQRTFEEGLTIWRTSCELALHLGCRRASMLVNSAKGNTREPEGTRLQIIDLQQRLYQVCAIAQSSGIQIAVEFVDAHLLLQAKEIIQGTRSLGIQNLGLLLDTYGLHSIAEPLPYLTELLQDRLISWVHLADAHWDLPGHVSIHEHQTQSSNNSQPLSPALRPRRVLPGQGHLPLRAELLLLQRHGYHGYSSIEVYGEQLFPEATPAIRARTAAEALLGNELLCPFFTTGEEGKNDMV